MKIRSCGEEKSIGAPLRVNRLTMSCPTERCLTRVCTFRAPLSARAKRPEPDFETSLDESPEALVRASTEWRLGESHRKPDAHLSARDGSERRLDDADLIRVGSDHRPDRERKRECSGKAYRV
jgi:hypothetical protein